MWSGRVGKQEDNRAASVDLAAAKSLSLVWLFVEVAGPGGRHESARANLRLIANRARRSACVSRGYQAP